MEKGIEIKKGKSYEEISAKEKKIAEENVNLPEKVKNFGESVFLFETPNYSDFLETLTEFKELNKELKITAISPLLTIHGGGVHSHIDGYCVNCEREKEEK